MGVFRLPISSYSDTSPGYSDDVLNEVGLAVGGYEDLPKEDSPNFRDGKWHGYRSLEGGPATIGYGHKQKPGEEGMFFNGITEEEARTLLREDLRESIKNSDLPPNLPPKVLTLVLDVSHRVGGNIKKRAPSFWKHIKNKDYAKAYIETADISYEDAQTGQRKFYNSRNLGIASDLLSESDLKEAQPEYDKKQLRALQTHKKKFPNLYRE